MKLINSRRTWYLIFGVLFVIILIIIFSRLLFRRNTEKITGNNRETLITQNETKSTGVKYIKVSPTPSPQATRKPFFTLFNEASPTPKASPRVSPSPSPSPTPNIEKEEKRGGGEETITSTVTVTKGNTEATKSSDLKVIENEDGTIYLTTENEDGSEDSYTRKVKANGFEKIVPPDGYAENIGEYINRLLRFVMMISALLVFAQLIWGGLEWIISGGDKGKVDGARNKITAAVIGLIIVASSFAILQLTLNFIGYQSINELLNLL